MEINGLKIQLRPIIYTGHLQPEGWLTRDWPCHALWMYYIMATNAKSVVGKSIDDQIIEYNAESGEAPPLWMDKRYNAQIKSIALLYGTTPEEMQRFWPNVKMEIQRLELTPVADEIEHLTGHDRIT